LGLGLDEVGQKGLKQPHLHDITHKKPETQNQNFFHCRHADLPNLLKAWTAR